MATDSGDAVTISTPPMVSFKTVSNALADFKAKGVLPPTIDKRIWPTYSNTVANQLVSALKFLRLIDDAGVPTSALQHLVAAHGDEEQWAEVLESTVRLSYMQVLDVELDKVHGSHLRDKFKEVFGLEGDPQRKAIAFFLFAARDAGMTLSPYLKLRERGPNRSASRKKRDKPPGGEERSGGGSNGGGEPGAGIGGTPKPRKIHEHQAALIEIINTYTDMTTEMRSALLDVVGFIAMKGVTS